ncbi:hypothetical protein L7F22_047260 [Adiantum nelumboides]|nr:hypothetical protein [Adiantum nelumboides]
MLAVAAVMLCSANAAYAINLRHFLWRALLSPSLTNPPPATGANVTSPPHTRHRSQRPRRRGLRAATPALPLRPSLDHMWCVASPTADSDALQAALDFVCATNPAYCAPLQPGQPCFLPNTTAAHASYAFNAYWLDLGYSHGHPCSFGGTALIAHSDPTDEEVRDIRVAFDKIKESIQYAQQKYKRAADKHRKPVQFKDGDWILLRFTKARLKTTTGKNWKRGANRSSKILHETAKRYYGPFQILSRINERAYKLRLPANWHIHNAFMLACVSPSKEILLQSQYKKNHLSLMTKRKSCNQRRSYDMKKIFYAVVRDPVDYNRPVKEVNLGVWLKVMVGNQRSEEVMVGNQRSEEVVDPNLIEKSSPCLLKRVLLIALCYMDLESKKRPKMGHVVHMLESKDFTSWDVRALLS